MTRIVFDRGNEVRVGDRRFVITHVLGFDAVMAQDMATGRPERLAVADLRPPLPAATATTIASAPDLSQLDGRDWDEARQPL